MKRIGAALGWLLIAGLGLGALGFVCVWLTLPARHARAAIPGLSAPATISYDPKGIPWIRAASDLDAAAALGYVHARDRLLQMDLMRRVASGRIAEIAGSAGLHSDMLMRTLGLRRRAEADLPLLPAHTRALLEAYSRGVNALIAQKGRFAAPEFLLLGAPAPWTPVDSLLWGKTMTLYLSANYRDELAHLALARLIPPDRIEGLWPAPPAPLPPQAALVPAGPLAHLAARLTRALPAFPAPYTLPRTASNEWAVDGAHSATGAPLLAGDPHLGLSLPGIWYLARIDVPGATLAGATAPGVPFLIIGRNADIAWTFTTTGADTQDIFVETPTDQTHYATPDGPRPFLMHDETIEVRGGPDHVLHVRETRHGPVISDVLGNAPDGQVLAVAMAGLAANDTASAGLDALNHARNLDQALAAAPLISAPNQNLLAADRHHIGFAVTGRIPLRRAGNGENAVDGASGAFDWTGYASGSQLPHLTDPASGRLVNGNEPVAPPDFPVLISHDIYGDWRARRIRALLDAHPRASVDDFVAMQTDVKSTYAAQILPYLTAARPTTPLGNKALDLLYHWDGSMRRDRPEPLIFNAWLQRFALSALDRNGVPNSDAGPRLEFVAGVLAADDSQWCGGDCAAATTAALEQAVADLARTQGPNLEAWRWGKLHRAIFAHPLLSQIPFLGRLTTRRIPADGDDSTVGRGAMAATPTPNFDDLHAASFRGVYDLADLDRSRFIAAPGQSGNIFDAHADDFIHQWRDGGTILLGPAPTHIMADATLTPAP